MSTKTSKFTIEVGLPHKGFIETHNDLLDKSTIGRRIKTSKELTVGRWYVVHYVFPTNSYIKLRAKYTGSSGSLHIFRVCLEDYKNFSIPQFVRVSKGTLNSNIPFRIFKFKQVNISTDNKNNSLQDLLKGIDEAKVEYEAAVAKAQELSKTIEKLKRQVYVLVGDYLPSVNK